MAWELGANMGHIDRMLVTARALRERGHAVTFALRDLSRAFDRVALAGFPLVQAPLWLPRLANPPRLTNYAGVLAGAGWLNPTGLAALLHAWRELLNRYAPDALVADHAPTALLAARGLPLQRWSCGNSFEIPPCSDGAFPSFMPDDPGEAARCPAYDAFVLQRANEALTRLGWPELPALTALFNGVHRAVMSLPELAHFEGYAAAEVHWPGPAYVGDSGGLAAWPEGPGPAVFAYLDPMNPQFDAVLAAITAYGARGLVHAKGIAPAVAARWAAQGIVIAPEPVRMDQALARADVVVSHASMGTVTAAALAGRPQLLLPTQPEQALVARRATATGAARVVGAKADTRAVARLLRELLDEGSCIDAARALAARHAGTGAEHSGRKVATLIEASLAPAS